MYQGFLAKGNLLSLRGQTQTVKILYCIDTIWNAPFETDNLGKRELQCDIW